MDYGTAEQIGKDITTLREQRGWNQSELARRLGKSPGEVNRWEKGKVRPTYDTFVKICEALGVEVGPTVITRKLVFDRREPAVRELTVTYGDDPAAPPQEGSVEWMLDMEGMVRNAYENEGLPPDELRAKRIDLVKGIILGRKERGSPVPPWMHALLGKLYSGDI